MNDIPILDNKKERDIIIKHYPSTEKIYNKYLKKLESGECTSCTKKSYKNKILKQIKDDQNKFDKNLSDDTVNLIRGNVKKTGKKEKDYCEDCIKKHLCTVLILLTEYIEGYVSHLDHAYAEMDEAKSEGLEIDIDLKNVTHARRKILSYLNIKSRFAIVIGLLNAAEEFIMNEDDIEYIREIRKKYM